jgi:hypothetical protein
MSRPKYKDRAKKFAPVIFSRDLMPDNKKLADNMLQALHDARNDIEIGLPLPGYLKDALVKFHCTKYEERINRFVIVAVRKAALEDYPVTRVSNKPKTAFQKAAEDLAPLFPELTQWKVADIYCNSDEAKNAEPNPAYIHEQKKD